MKRFLILLLCIMLIVTMTPVIAFADSNQKTGSQNTSSMRIYAIYMHRANGAQVSSDRYGDAVLIESNGEYLLIDTGTDTPIKDSSTVYKSNLVNALKSIGVSKLSVYISHVHGDHTGGLEDICDAFIVDKIYLPDIEVCKDYETPNTHKKVVEIYADQQKIATDEGAQIVYLAPSFRTHAAETTYNTLSVGSVQGSVIGPVGTYTVEQFRNQDGDCGTMEGHYLNNCSLCTIFTCGSFKFMAAGDVETQEETALANRYGYGLDCNMMKLSHHGLRTSNKSNFVGLVSPTWSFQEDHGFSSSISASVKTASNYGFNYGVATNKHSLIIDVNNNAARFFVDYNNNNRRDDGLLTGWVQTRSNYQYYDGAGYLHTGWTNVGSDTYYLNGLTGFRVTGKQTINGKKCKFKNNGKLYDPAKPKKAKIYSGTAKKKGHKIKIRWKKVSGANAYQVFRANSKNGAYVLLKTYGKGKRSFTESGTVKGKKYYYKVRALKYYAGATICGSMSKAKKVKAK